MPFQNLTLSDLRTKALAFQGDINSDSRYGPAVSGATGSLVDGFINDALVDMTTDWLGIEDKWSFNAVVGQRDYDLPDGFRTAKSVFYNGVPLVERPIEEFNFFAPGNSWPTLFSIWKNKVILGANPPYQAYLVVMWYWRSPQELVQDGDVPEIPNEYRPALAYYAGAQQALAEGEIATHDKWMEKYERVKRAFTEYLQGKTTQHPQVRNITDPWGILWV